MLVGCKPAGSSTAEPHYGQPGKSYPPSAVAALSITSSSVPLGETPDEAAVNCAAAIRITRAALVASNVSLESEAQKTLDQAEAIFVRRAKKLDADKASSEIAERQSAMSDQTAAQAQLTLSCIKAIAQ